MAIFGGQSSDAVGRSHHHHRIERSEIMVRATLAVLLSAVTARRSALEGRYINLSTTRTTVASTTTVVAVVKNRSDGGLLAVNVVGGIL